jgi:3-hydroxyisobutyrate dehydrogenase-like beta-hydroxyacid dehydrogenase
VSRREVVAVWGLGNMGLAVARRLKLRFRVFGFDPSAERRELASRDGIETTADAASLGTQCRTAVLSLPRPAISLDVVSELVKQFRPGGAIVETSTVAPSDARAMYRTCAEHGVAFVDAAILSGVGLVESGKSALIVGGTQADVAAVQDVLDAIAPRQTIYGKPGSGMAAKVINNAVAHAVYVVLVEATALGRACGLEVDDVVELLSREDAGLVRPLTHRIGERVRQRSYQSGMPTEAARKDSALALGLANDTKVPLFAIQGAHTVYEIAAADESLARLDYAALALLWERWTGRPFAGVDQDNEKPDQ